MMNRDRLNFWVRVFAFFIAGVFLLSFAFVGLGTANININPADLFGNNNNSSQQQQQPGQSVDLKDQIQAAKKNLDKNPKNAEAIRSLAVLYYRDNQPDKAAQVLENGRETLPKNPDIANLLGQVYADQAQKAAPGEQKKLYGKAADAFAAAARIQPKNAQSYLFAGDAYQQAGQPAEAIKYWNGYLKLEPKGQQAKQVKDQISQLLKGGGTTARRIREHESVTRR